MNVPSLDSGSTLGPVGISAHIAADAAQFADPGTVLRNGKLLNRAERRTQLPPTEPGPIAKLWRGTAVVALIAFLHTTLPPLHTLSAQPFQGFDEQSRDDMEQYVDRANRLNDLNAWNNYVATGIAQERVQWEETAYGALRDELLRQGADEMSAEDREILEADLQAQLDTALTEWEADALAYFDEERGAYRGEQAVIDAAFAAESEYAALIAQVEAQTAADLKLDLAGWDARVAVGLTPLTDRFENDLTADLAAARAAFTGSDEERAAFEAKLNERAAKMRSEFEFRDHFYLLSARNSYVARIRADDVSARVIADASSADAVAEQVLAKTSADLNANTTDMLNSARTQIDSLSDGGVSSTTADISTLSGDWEKQVESTISAGLRRWNEAEEQLYAERLKWQAESKRSRAEGEAIWKANHDKLVEAREEWLRDIRQQIKDGRGLWEAKFTEFASSRSAAEAQLDDFVAEELARRKATMDRLGEMVRGGGKSLLEAKQSYAYYEGLLTEMGSKNCTSQDGSRETTMYCFYKEQRDQTRAAIARFQKILGDSEVALGGVMHSDANNSGFLNDRRSYAGDLVGRIAGINVASFEADLQSEIDSRGEDFLLYKRDLSGIIESNGLFTERTTELATSGALNFESVGNTASLRELVVGLDIKYDDHRRELLAILDVDRSALATDADRLNAIKAEFRTWFTDSQNRNGRLRRVVLDYFQGGQAGYYLSANENDPYYMTAAELEWEQLRRERNYLAKRLRTAEAVKRYADLAEANEAGLELAQVTAERAEIASTRRNLRELHYLLLKGDLAVDPLARSNLAVRDAEFTRLLSERGINEAELFACEARLGAEQTILSNVLASGTPPGSAALQSAAADIDRYLTANVPSEQHATHRMYSLRGKLLTLAEEIDSGQTATYIANRWTVISSGMGAVNAELTQLIADYDFNSFRAEFNTVRGSVADVSLTERQAAVTDLRAAIEANAEAIATARANLDAAQAAYSQARKQNDILRAANSGDLINKALLDTTNQLAAVLNRMTTIEALPGFDTSQPQDQLSVRRAEYLRMVSERQSADADLARSQDVLKAVRGLEDAKVRNKNLTDLLSGAGDLSLLGAEVLADVFLNHEAQLLARSAATTEQQSYPRSIQHFDELANVRAALVAARGELATAIANNDPAADIEVLRATVSTHESRISELSGLIISNIRGEVGVRTSIVQSLLDPALAPNPAVLAKDNAALVAAINQRGRELAGVAARDLATFLAANREQDYAAILAAANAAVVAAPLPPRVDGGPLTLQSEANRDAMRAQLVRQWVLENRALLQAMSAAPVAGANESPVSVKWDQLLKRMDSLALGSNFAANFRGNLPVDAADSRIVAIQTEREAVLANLDSVLTAADGVALSAAYDALSAADRALLARYGRVAAPSLRADLTSIRSAVANDLARIPTQFLQVFLQQQAYDAQLALQRSSRVYASESAQLAELRAESDALNADITTWQARIDVETDSTILARLTEQHDAAQDRVDALAPRLTALQTQVDNRAASLREHQNRLMEIKQPGSSAPLLANALALVSGEAESAQLLNRLQQSTTDYAATSEPTTAELQDQLKAIIGFYKTDATGVIVRDSGDRPIVSAEFQALSINNPDASLADVLAGNQRGDHLARWSNRLRDWFQDPAKAGSAPRELLAAVELLALSVQNYENAVAFIENRGADAATLAATADVREANAAAYLEKLRALQSFEQRLKDSIEQARARSANAKAVGAGESPAQAALRILEDPANQYIFQLFRGYDLKGAPDSLADPDLQARADRLRKLAQTLRASARESRLLQMADRYAQGMEVYITTARAAADPSTIAPPGRAGFFSSFVELNSAAVLAHFSGIPADDGFRSAATEWLRVDGTLPQNVFFREAVLTALGDTVGSGAPLRTAVLANIDSLLTKVNAQLGNYLDEMDFIAMRDAFVPAGSADPDVTTALAALMTAKPGLSTEEQQRLKSEVPGRELNRALQIAANTDSYVAAHYPAELRNFVLVQQYAAATERYARYQAARSSSIATEHDLATLDLRGLNGDYARHILARDFADYQAATPAQSVGGAVDAAAANGDALTLNAYLNQYLQARNLNPALLPDGGRQLLLTVELQEYKRIFADASAAGGLHLLNENKYAADFGDFVRLAMIQDFVTARSITLSGSTEAERKIEFRAFFESALDDVAYTRDGKSLRVRLRGSANMERLFAQAFASMESGGVFPLALNLPASVASADPTQALPTPEDYLPQELRAISGYDSADPVALIATVGPEYGRAFALRETQRALRPADLMPGLNSSPAELDAILARAGFSGATALGAADRTAVHSALRAAIAGASLAQRGATSPEQALAVLREDRAVAALAGDDQGLAEQRLLLASGVIAKLDQRADALIASSDVPLAGHRSALARALAESLYVARGASGDFSAETSAFFDAVPGSQALVEAQVAKGQLSADLAGVLLRDFAIVDRYFRLVQESDGDRAYVESLFTDQTLATPLARLGLRSDLRKAQAIQSLQNSRAVAGLFASLADGKDLQRAREREWGSEIEKARALRKFSGKINANPSLISFGHYRTFIGSERGAQQAAYDKYINSSPPDPADSFAQFHKARVLAADSLNEDPTELFKQSADQWMDRLRSDNPTQLGASVDLDGDGDASNDPRSVVVKTVSNETMRLAAGSTDKQLRYIYQEALANNYLEAVTRMNTAFTGVFRSASLAGTRTAEHSANAVAASVLATGYNVMAAAGESDLSGIEALVQDASDRQAANGNTQLQQTRILVRATAEELDKVGAEFADAARRKHIADNGALSFLEDNFKPIADNLAAAESAMNAATAAGDALQNEFAARNSRYVTGLNELSKRFRAFSEASDEFERRQSVKEYANTPYLFASSSVDSEATDGFSADARAEYNLALRALKAAQSRLDQAALNVRAEARLDDLKALVIGLDGGLTYSPLSSAERAQLAELRDRDSRVGVTLSATENDLFNALRLRETYEKYGDVLQARAEHIRHSLRMVRLHKAREVINAEIERRRAVAEERRRAFEQEMDRTFGSMSDEQKIAARNLVYQRLVSKIGNNQAYFNEFRAWYSLTKPEDKKLPEGNTGNQPRPKQQLAEADAEAGKLSSVEQAAIKAFIAAGGRLAEYSVFAGTYFSYLNALGVQDVAQQELELTKITSGISIGVGTGMIAYGTALVAAIFTAGFGWGLIAAGSAMITAAGLAIHIMQVKYDGRKKEADDLRAIAESAAKDDSVKRVRQKQVAYEQALAELDYFLRAPDLKTAKERIIQWGQEHGDDNAYGTETRSPKLYQLTDDDLKYLFDSGASGDRFVASNGNALALSTEEAAEALDVASLRKDTVFKDSFGRRFNADPAKLLDEAPGTLQNGVYRSGGTDYIEIRVTNHKGLSEIKYAPLIGNTSGVPKDRVYSLGALLDKTVEHGTRLRNQRRDKYLTAGEDAIAANDADRSMILKDRDAAFARLFADAANREIGGREFSGYRLVYEEYEATQRKVLQRELQQRRQLQKKEWDLRQRELKDRYRLWDKRMQTLLAEGTDHWGRVSDNYLQEWREWERKHEATVQRGEEEWRNKVKAHYTAREKWEQETRQAAAEKTAEVVLTESIQELNRQISSSRSEFGLKLENIHTTATVNAAIDEIRRSQPSTVGLTNSITESVNSFQTRLDISTLTGANTGGSIVSLSGQFREEARQHQRRMRTLANVKAAEQYQRMIALFAEQIEVQNDQIENSTKAAAFAAGFALDGDLFTKEAGISGATASVNKYNRFQTKIVIEKELSKAGTSRLSAAELTNFLEAKSDFEVQLYFENQRLITRGVFDLIIGTDPSKRGESDDRAEIGLFGFWVGAAGDPDDPDAVEGFGELGASAEKGRPGKKEVAGFFPQLNAAAEDLAKADADKLSAASGGPIVQGLLGFVNGLNPAMMVMNTVTNIQKAVINGAPLGDVIGANMLNLVKQIGMSVGSVLLSMSGVGVGLAAGIMLTMVSSMIQANTETGEIGFGMTDAALYSSLLAIGGARFGVGLKFAGDKATKALKGFSEINPKIGGAMTGTLGLAPAVVTGAAQNFGQAGMQFDQDGNYVGFDYNAAAVGAVVGGVSGGAMTRYGLQPYKSGTTRQHFMAEYSQHAITSAATQTGEVFKAYSGVAPANLDMMGGDLSSLVGMMGSAVMNRAKYSTGLEGYEAPMENVLWKARQGIGNAIYNNSSRARAIYDGTPEVLSNMRTGIANRFHSVGNSMYDNSVVARTFYDNLPSRQTMAGYMPTLQGTINKADWAMHAPGNALYNNSARARAVYDDGPQAVRTFMQNRYNGAREVIGKMGAATAEFMRNRYNGAAAMAHDMRHRLKSSMEGWAIFRRRETDPYELTWSDIRGAVAGAAWDGIKSASIATAKGLGELAVGAGHLAVETGKFTIGLGQLAGEGLGKLAGGMGQLASYLGNNVPGIKQAVAYVGQKRDAYWEWNNRLKWGKDQARYGRVDDSASYEDRKGDLMTREDYLKAFKGSGGLDNRLLPGTQGFDETIVNRWNTMVDKRSDIQAGVKAKPSGEIAGLFDGEGQEELKEIWEKHREEFWQNLGDY